MFDRKKGDKSSIIVITEPRILRFHPSPSAQSELVAKTSPASQSECPPHPQKHLKNRITPQFAYDLLMSEIHLETCDKASKQIIEKLFELYKIGIEYYNTKQDTAKEGYFKKKLDSLSMHPTVLGMLHEEKRNDDNFYKKKQIERLVEINNKETLGDVESMIKRIERVEDSTRETVEKGLSKQIEEIRKRIEKRKLTAKTTSVKDESDMMAADETHSPMQKPKLRAYKSSTSKKGSVSFASPEEEDNYDNLFVEGKFANDC